jgi:general secretion pathway protein D
MVLVACDTPKTGSEVFFKDALPSPGVTAPAADQGSLDPLDPQSLPDEPELGIVAFEVRGSGRLAGAPRHAPSGLQIAQIEDTAAGVTLNFVDADLREVIRAVLEDTLDLNYVIDPNVQGRVTLQTSQPLDPVLSTRWTRAAVHPELPAKLA